MKFLQAAKENKLDVLKKEYENSSVDILATDGDGKTALHWAVDHRNLKMMEFLLPEVNIPKVKELLSIRQPGHPRGFRDALVVFDAT